MLLKSKQNKKEKGKTKDELHNPKILDVNLIKGEVRVSFDWRRRMPLLIFIILVTTLFVLEISFGLNWWEEQENSRVQVLTQKVLQTNKEISQLKIESSQAIEYRDKAFEVNKLLDSHIYWTNFLSWLERNTLSSVSFGGLRGGLKGVYSLEARAQRFADVSWQAKILRDDPAVKKVEVLLVESFLNDDTGEKEVGFIINLEVNPELFKK